jgi:acetyl-CoA acetyltransferase
VTIRRAAIVAPLRIPVGNPGGALSGVHPVDLLATV